MKKLFEELKFEEFKDYLDQLHQPKLVKTLAIFCYNFQCDLSEKLLREIYDNLNVNQPISYQSFNLILVYISYPKNILLLSDQFQLPFK